MSEAMHEAMLLSVYALTVGTPPPDDTWHASLSGATPSGLPEVGHVAHISF